MSIYKRGEVWYIYLTHHGQRIRESAHTTERQEAQRQHDELKAQLWQRKRVSGKTWREAVAAWVKHAPRDESDLYRLRALNVPDLPLAEFTAESLLDIIGERSPATHNRYCNMVSAILNLAGHPIKLKRRKLPPGTFRWLTRAEWRKLEKCLPPHLLPLARFAVYTGLRQWNVTHLRWEWIDMRRRIATVPPEEMKAGRVITIPLSNDAMNVLRSQVGKNADWVFPYKSGMPLGRIKLAWGKACARAGIKCRWHDLRHTWASWHVQDGTPLNVLQELGGWATYAMVLKYAHLSPDHLRKWVNNATKVRHTGGRKHA